MNLKPCKFCKKRKFLHHTNIEVLPKEYYLPLFDETEHDDGNCNSIKIKLGGGDYIAVTCDSCGAIGPFAKSKAWATRRYNNGKVK